MKGKNELLQLLKSLEITYLSYSHKPINNVKDAQLYAKEIKGAHCKNLFLKDSQEKLFLAITPEEKRVDLKKLAEYVNSKRLSFVSEEFLQQYLGIKAGCGTPFALMNDYKKEIIVLVDEELLTEETLSFHPFVNTETLDIRLEDLYKFFDYLGQKCIILKI